MRKKKNEQEDERLRKKRTNEQEDERTREKKNKRTNKRMRKRRTNKHTNERTIKKKNEQTNERMRRRRIILYMCLLFLLSKRKGENMKDIKTGETMETAEAVETFCLKDMEAFTWLPSEGYEGPHMVL